MGRDRVPQHTSIVRVSPPPIVLPVSAHPIEDVEGAYLHGQKTAERISIS